MCVRAYNKDHALRWPPSDSVIIKPLSVFSKQASEDCKLLFLEYKLIDTLKCKVLSPDIRFLFI